MERYVQPPQYTDIAGNDLVFLAGPVQGAPDWQSQLAGPLLAAHEKLWVASPRRDNNIGFDLSEQVFWEWAHIDRASARGAIAFWFAAQDPTIPYQQGRAYAQTSRVEIGQVFGWRKYQPSIKVAVGFDPTYTPQGGGNERYIRMLCDKHSVSVQGSLDELQAAITDLL